MATATHIEVRRHNGQNAYGEWIRREDGSLAGVPTYVWGLVDDERAEHPSAGGGRVEQGGAIWLWRESQS